MIHSIRRWACSALLLAMGATQAATPEVLQARELLDGYYGRSQRLAQAAGLLQTALQEQSDPDAETCVEVARLIVMGGHIVAEKFRPSTVERYHEWLDKALEADPSNPKAHILKAEAYAIQHRYADEKAELDRAKKAGTKDPWLEVGYAKYYGHVGDNTAAYYTLDAVREAGPGTTASQRKAFIAALQELSSFKVPGDPKAELRALADLARKERSPEDAWVLGNFADSFIFHAMFDDAIAFAREAVSVMDYGAGRLSLAAALYGKAAMLTRDKKAKEAQKLIQQARSFGFERESVLGRLARGGPEDQDLMPTLERIVK